MVRGELPEEYLLKLGIFTVEPRSSALAKGLWKEDFASATPLRCWQEVTAARVVGSCWRAQARSREPEAEESDMVMQLTTEGVTAIALRGGRGGREVDEAGTKLEPELSLAIGITGPVIGWPGLGRTSFLPSPCRLYAGNLPCSLLSIAFEFVHCFNSFDGLFFRLISTELNHPQSRCDPKSQLAKQQHQTSQELQCKALEQDQNI